jgi:quercetin dioxygenase-like cupin family protein
VTESITRTTLADVALAQAKTVERIEIRRIRIPAGVAGGLHIHNCPVVGCILEGSVAYQVEGERVVVLVPGDVFYEAEGARIARFDALDDDVTFVAHFLLSVGQQPELDVPAG